MAHKLSTNTHAHKHQHMHIYPCEHTRLYYAASVQRDIIKLPPGIPPGLPCLVTADQRREANRAHVATQPSSESCLFHDCRETEGVSYLAPSSGSNQVQQQTLLTIFNTACFDMMLGSWLDINSCMLLNVLNESYDCRSIRIQSKHISVNPE